MQLQLFPTLSSRVLERILVSEGHVLGSDDIYLEAIGFLEQMGILYSWRRRFTKCVNEDDPDYHQLSYEARLCEGEIGLEFDECPVCGRQIEDQLVKGYFERSYFVVQYDGVFTYLQKALRSLPNVDVVTKVVGNTISLQLYNQKSLNVVLISPETTLDERCRGLYFGETPYLYVYISPYECPPTDIINEIAILWLGDFLSDTPNVIEKHIDLAATAIDVKTYHDFSYASEQFDRFASDIKWQDFEQRFIPELLSRIIQQPNKLENYLDQLERLDSSILGSFPIAIGGSGKTDLRFISKFEIVNTAFSSRNIGDAKNYTGKTILISEDISVILGHLMKIPEAERSSTIVFVSSDNIASTAWKDAIELRDANQYWLVVIIPKYLIVELLIVFDAFDLIG